MTFIIFLPGNDLRSEKNEGENILLFLKLYLFAGKIAFLGRSLRGGKFMILYKWGMSGALKICHHNKYVSTLSLS